MNITVEKQLATVQNGPISGYKLQTHHKTNRLLKKTSRARQPSLVRDELRGRTRAQLIQLFSLKLLSLLHQ